MTFCALQIVDKVHANGSYIFLQLAALGHGTDPDRLKAENPNFNFVRPSEIPVPPNKPTPRALIVDEIETYVQWYADAANKAINKTGFDGVKLHFANGYLPDQFLQDMSNQQSDRYGGLIENRARFPLEIIKAISNAVGQDRVRFWVSPWSTWQGMRMEDPKLMFSYLVSQAKENFPDLAYLHVIENKNDMESNKFLRKIWDDKVFIAAGGYTLQTAVETIWTAA